MQHLAIGMLRRFEGQPGRPAQLADDDALGAVDDERALRGHQRQFAHEHLFRLEGDASAWRKSLYELVCNSIRLGGAMISLILPKLIRSVARVGIWAFN